MKQPSQDEIRAEIDAIDSELTKWPDDPQAALSRVLDIMLVASAQDMSRASYSLGMIYEALLPVRTRSRLLAKRQQLLKALTTFQEDV